MRVRLLARRLGRAGAGAAAKQRRPVRPGHRPDRVADVVPAATTGTRPATTASTTRRTSSSFAPRSRSRCSACRTSFASRSPTSRRRASGQSGLGDTQVFNLTVFGAAMGPLGRRHFGFGADGARRPELRQVDGRPGRWASSTRRTRATTSACSRRPSSRSPATTARPTSASSTCSRSSATNSAAAARSRSATAPSSTTRAKSRWASLALGVNYGQVISLWGQKWRPNAEVDYDFQDRTGNPKVTLRAGFTLLLPSL